MSLLKNDYNDEELDDENEENEEYEPEGDAELNEEKYFTIDYKCEDCDYMWKAKQQAELSDESVDDDQWVIDESNISCPICGSCNVARL